MSEYKGAWHGDPALKAEVLARMIEHRANDEIVRGHYQKYNPEKASKYTGCLIGCTLPMQGPVKATWGNEYLYIKDTDWHRKVEEEYGISVWVARLLEDTFEDADFFEEAAAFAVASIEAIPVGADYRGLSVDECGYIATWFGCAEDVLEALRNAPIVGEGL